MDPVTYLLTLLPARYAMPVLAMIGLCAVLDAVLPQPPAGSRWGAVRRVLSVVGANWMNARNAVPSKTTR